MNDSVLQKSPRTIDRRRLWDFHRRPATATTSGLSERISRFAIPAISRRISGQAARLDGLALASRGTTNWVCELGAHNRSQLASSATRSQLTAVGAVIGRLVGQQELELDLAASRLLVLLIGDCLFCPQLEPCLCRRPLETAVTTPLAVGWRLRWP